MQVYKPSNFTDDLAVRSINKNLKRILKAKQSDRQTIINQIKILLREETPFKVLKLDIKNFYESIDRKKLLHTVWDDPIISFRTKVLIEKLFASPQINEISGLPRGLALSSTLSEFLLQDFDQTLTAMKGVYYYARYVDDIIIFCFMNENSIKKSAIAELQKVGLQLNEEKTKLFSAENSKTNPIEFDYLGYQFIKTGANTKTNIANKKIKKIKSRIVRSFLDHHKNPNFNLLLERIRYLAGNHRLDSRSRIEGSPLKTGIYYNYPQIDEDSTSLKDLDQFLRKQIFSKTNSFGHKQSQLLTSEQKNKLAKISFKSGFNNRLTHNYTYNKMMMIKSCWEK
nr:antiviral reverse transcriptase Drt3a [Halomonas utahensis]